MVDEVKRAKSHWNQVLEKALHTQEATLKAEERMGKFSEKVIGELASTAKSLGGKIESLEHETGKRDEKRLTAIQMVKHELTGASRRNERRTSHALDELAAKMREFRKELNERRKENNAALGRHREAIRIVITKVDRVMAQNEREVAALKKESEEQRKSTATLKVLVDDSVGGLWKNIGMLQGEFGYEVEAIRKDLGKIHDENRKLQDLEQRLKILEKGHADRGIEYERRVESLEKEKSEVEERWKASELRAVGNVRRIDMLETKVRISEEKLARFIEDAKGRMGRMVSEERENELLTRVAALEAEVARMVGEHAAPSVMEPRSVKPGDSPGRRAQVVDYTPARSGDNDGSTQRGRGAESRAKPSIAKFSLKDGRPSDIGGGPDEEDGRSGMNWCEDIKIGETAPTSLNIISWISGVAQAARIAYLYDQDYACKSIGEVLRVSETERGRPLIYPALENKLYQARRDTGKPNTPEMNAITTLELKATGERPPTALQLMHVLLDRIRVPQEDENAVYAEAILVINEIHGHAGEV